MACCVPGYSMQSVLLASLSCGRSHVFVYIHWQSHVRRAQPTVSTSTSQCKSFLHAEIWSSWKSCLNAMNTTFACVCMWKLCFWLLFLCREHLAPKFLVGVIPLWCLPSHTAWNTKPHNSICFPTWLSLYSYQSSSQAGSMLTNHYATWFSWTVTTLEWNEAAWA